MNLGSISPVRLPVTIVPGIDETALEALRQRLAEILAVPVPAKLMPSLPPAQYDGYQVIQAPLALTEPGATMMHHADGEWAEVLPGLECRLAGIATEPHGMGIEFDVAARKARAVLEFRLTPQDGQAQD